MAETKPSAQTYASDLTRGLADISNGGVRAELSFAGQGALDVLSLAIQGETGKSLSGAASLASSALTPVVDVASRTLLSLASAAGAASFIAGAVPLIGAIVGVLTLPLVSPASGTGPDSSDIEVRKAFCLAQFRPVVHGPTKSSAGAVPADIFALKDIGGTSYEGGYRSTVGVVLEVMTEKNPLVPAKKRGIFKKLRRAIEGQYQVKGSDGGAAIMPLYLDLLLSESRRWVRDYGNTETWQNVHAALIKDAYWPVGYSPAGEECPSGWHGAYAGCSCFYFDKRGLEQAQAMLAQWDTLVNPVYAQEQAATADVREMVERAKREFGMSGGTSRGGLLLLAGLGVGVFAAYNPIAARAAASWVRSLPGRARTLVTRTTW